MNISVPLPPVRSKRLLSIDGGGLCGLIPAEALILIEKQLDDLTGMCGEKQVEVILRGAVRHGGGERVDVRRHRRRRGRH